MLIDCLARAGRRAEALRQFEICARVLRTEFDIAPDAETIALAHRIRAGSWRPPMVRERPRTDALPANVVGAVQKDAVHPMADPEIAEPGIADPEIGATCVAPAPVGLALVPARRSRRLRRRFAWIAAAVWVVAISLVLASLLPFLRPPSLGVSGFHNVSGIPNRDGVFGGFGVLVSNSLVMQQHLRLIKDPADDTRDTLQARDRIQQAAGVRYLLRGSVAFETNGLHVTARLTDVRSGTELWSDHYDIPVFEAPRPADDIAAGTARAILQDRDINIGASLPAYHGGRRAAQELVALGQRIDYLNAATPGVAHNIYRLALQVDKDGIDVLAHLANSDIRAAASTSPTDRAALASVDAILQHTMQLDPMGEFALVNAFLLRRVRGRVPETIELCKRALDIDPRRPGALRELGHDLLLSGEAEQAIVSYRASIDAAPYLPYAYNTFKGLGAASLALGRREDAIMYLRKATELDIRSAENEQLWVAEVLEMDGRHAEAAQLGAEFIGRHPGQRIDNGFVELLRAPAYADRRKQVLAALASVGYSK